MYSGDELGLDSVRQAKLRQQMIERGQMVSQEISYEGFTLNFGVVPVTDAIEGKLDRIHQGVAVAERELLKQGKKGLSDRIAAFEATYTKAFLERSRIPEAIQLAKRARAAGWQVIFFSETTSEDLFRRPVEPQEEAGMYRQLDEDSGGMIGRIMPEFPNVFHVLQAEFGEEIGDYGGSGSTDAQREETKEAFLKGRKPLLNTSYAEGGTGGSLHDTGGDKPRVSIFLGPPYSGVLLEQAIGRTWQFGVKSNARAVLLATDSAPDIRLMANFIGPRMKALRACVLGERDSLSAVMAYYTDEQMERAHQDALAFDQGREAQVDAQSFRVRSGCKVNFDNWSSITFPNAAEAMYEGMRAPMSGGGKVSDWTMFYQEKPKRWESPNRPLTIEDIRARRAFYAAAEKAANPMGNTPSDLPVQLSPTIDHSQLPMSDSCKETPLSFIQGGPATPVRDVQDVGGKETAPMPLSPNLACVELGRWNIWGSFAVLSALALMWGIFGSLFQRGFLTFCFLVSVAVGGIACKTGPLGIFRSFARHPERLRNDLRAYEGADVCKRHGLSHCQVCLAYQWDDHRSGTWVITAGLLFLILGLFMVPSSSGSAEEIFFHRDEVSLVAFILHFVCGALFAILLISRSTTPIPSMQKGHPLRTWWAILKSADKFILVPLLVGIFCCLTIISSPFWHLFLTRSADEISLDPLMLTVTSVSTYSMAMFWSLESRERTAKWNAMQRPDE